VAARVASRRGKLGVYWRDALGGRHFVVCPDEDKRRELLERLGTAGSPDASTVADYAALWLERVRVRSARQTFEGYGRAVRIHIVPAEIGHMKLIELKRRHCKDWVTAQLATDARRRTIGWRVSVLRAMLEEAIEDELISVNPAASLIKAMRIPMKSKDVAGVDAGDAGKLLEAAREEKAFPGIALCMHTGLRRGEAFGLRWADVDLEARTGNVVRQMHLTGEVEGLKTDKSRRQVDLPAALVEMMRSWRARQCEEALREGRPPTEYVLGTEPVDARRARDRMAGALRRSLKRAGLPFHLSIHGLRHAYASLQLSMGRELAYVQQQLGHSTVSLTADLYGCHVRRRDRDGADALGNVLKGGQMGLWRKK